MAGLDKGNLYRWKSSCSQGSQWMDALTNFCLRRASITDAEFRQKLLEERAVYQRILHPTTQ
jgi:hypothetical protein